MIKILKKTPESDSGPSPQCRSMKLDAKISINPHSSNNTRWPIPLRRAVDRAGACAFNNNFDPIGAKRRKGGAVDHGSSDRIKRPHQARRFPMSAKAPFKSGA